MDEAVTRTKPPSAGYVPGREYLAPVSAGMRAVPEIQGKHLMRRRRHVRDEGLAGIQSLEAAVVAAKKRHVKRKSFSDLRAIAQLVIKELFSLDARVAVNLRDSEIATSERDNRLVKGNTHV